MYDRVPLPVARFLRRSGARLAALGAAFAMVLAFSTPAGATTTHGAAVTRGALPAVAPIIPFGCAKAVTGQAHCLGRGRLAPTTSGSPASSGLKPADLISAYKLSGTNGAGRTVAVVDAFDDPNAAADLAVYRSAYGLPACTTASGCFKKVNGSGQTSPLPAADSGWAEEESLDLDMVSAICPGCHILLVEASRGGHRLARPRPRTPPRRPPGVASISNSWGAAEDSSTLAADSHFNHPGVAITASSGDSGYGVSWPAASQYVTAVGGTTLKTASNARGWTETAWSGAGSGCSTQEPKPSLAEGHRLRAPHGRGRVRGRRPGHRRGRLRHREQLRRRVVLRPAAVAGAGHRRRRLGAGRRDQRVLADHRLGLRTGREQQRGAVRVLPVRAHRLAVRRHQRHQRQLHAGVPVHGRSRLRRPDRAGHAERDRGVLTF